MKLKIPQWGYCEIYNIVKSKNEEEDRGNSTRLANQARVNGGSGGAQGAAAKPVVVAKTQVAKGTNTNTKEENLNYIETKNQLWCNKSKS